jgi:DNA-binding IclR family transcriptional regulator
MVSTLTRAKPAKQATALAVATPQPVHSLPGGDRQFVTSLARGLEILNCFRGAQLDISGSELAAMTGLPQPTVWRLCHTMIRLGFLITASGDRLRPGLRLLKLGQAALAGIPLLGKSYDSIQWLAQTCHGAVCLAAWNGGRLVLVQQGLSEGQSLMNLTVGARIDLITPGLGWGFLAGFREDEREVLLVDLIASDPRWTKLESVFRAEMARYKNGGYVLSIGSWHQDFNTIAVPVIGPAGTPAFALSCTGAAVTHDAALLKRDVAPKLLKIATLFEQDLHGQQREQKGRRRQGRGV